MTKISKRPNIAVHYIELAQIGAMVNGLSLSEWVELAIQEKFKRDRIAQQLEEKSKSLAA